MIAGTIVIRQPQAVLLPDLTARPAPGHDRFAFHSGQLDHYGRYELQTLEQVLQAETRGGSESRGRRRANLEAISRTIRTKIGYRDRSEEHTSELQSLMRISYAVFCLKNKKP